MVVEDSLIELNSGASSNANDCGIVIERGSTGNNAFMGWDESADKFLMGTTTATGASTGNLSVTTGTLVANLEGNATSVTNGVYTTSSVTALSDVSSVGSGSIITSSERTKLSGIATSANNYSLPTASASALGGVKVGTGLAIDGSGVLSSTSSGKWSGSTDIYYNSGDVGIGTTSPTEKLEIGENSTTHDSTDKIMCVSQQKTYKYNFGITKWNKYSSGSGKYDLEIGYKDTGNTTNNNNYGHIILKHKLNVGFGTTIHGYNL